MKGKRLYLPAMVVKEMEDIKEEDNIEQTCIAFRELVKYARVGREINRWMKLDMRRKPLKYDLEKDDLENYKEIKGYKINEKANGKDYLPSGVING